VGVLPADEGDLRPCAHGEDGHSNRAAAILCVGGAFWVARLTCGAAAPGRLRGWGGAGSYPPVAISSPNSADRPSHPVRRGRCPGQRQTAAGLRDEVFLVHLVQAAVQLVVDVEEETVPVQARTFVPRFDPIAVRVHLVLPTPAPANSRPATGCSPLRDPTAPTANQNPARASPNALFPQPPTHQPTRPTQPYRLNNGIDSPILIGTAHPVTISITEN
jgi:hypothetical protein